MNEISILDLKENEKKALLELKESLIRKFGNVKIILFGSKVRGDFDEESDIDILILMDCLITSKIEEEISEIAYEIELKYEVVFGKIIENIDFKDTAESKIPLYQNIEKEYFVVGSVKK